MLAAFPKRRSDVQNRALGVELWRLHFWKYVPGDVIVRVDEPWKDVCIRSLNGGCARWSRAPPTQLIVSPLTTTFPTFTPSGVLVVSPADRHVNGSVEPFGD